MKFILLFFLLLDSCKIQSIIRKDSYYNKWANAVVNIHCETRPHKWASEGTAIYFKYNNRHFLLTARHVLFGDSLQFPEFIWANLRLRSQPVLPIHALGDMNDIYPHPYILSSVDTDIAIIDLDQFIPGINFWKNLDSTGYSAINFSDIDTSCSIKNSDFIGLVGFPDFIKDGAKSDHNFWLSINDPVFSFGNIQNVQKDSICFVGNVLAGEGNSGGPAINKKNKIIGIVHGPNGNTTFQTSNSYKYHVTGIYFIKSSVIFPLLIRLESTLGK